MLSGAALVLAGQAGAPLLFSDPLDGPARSGWRVAPTSFVKAPDGSRAARFERGSTWSAEGQPWAGDREWSSYRIEVEIWPEKNWAGMDFHVQRDGVSAAELTMYRIDGKLALELSGIWGASSAWKLWPVGQKMLPHPEGWVRLRMDVGPEAMNVFLGDSPEAAATYRDLPFRSGGIRLATYHGSALFRNLRVTRLDAGEVVPQLEDPWKAARGEGVLRDWLVSPRFEPDAAPAEPPAVDGSWLTPLVDSRGVVHLTALYPKANQSGVAFARTALKASAGGEKRLRVTYTDSFTLWCNGAKVFEGPPRQWFHPDRARNGYSRLMPDQYEIVVPVREGENSLVVRSETTEPFGWGFWAREVR